MTFYGRTPLYIKQSLQDALRENYTLGVKLVRGAYHPHEIVSHKLSCMRRGFEPGTEDLNSSTEHVELISNEALPHSMASHMESLSISPDLLPPVYLDKDETDRCYDITAGILLNAVQESLSSASSGPQVGVLFGTHNQRSCGQIIETMLNLGMASELSTSDQNGKIIRVDDSVAERVTIGQLYGMS